MLDTKLRNNRIIKVVISIVMVLTVTVGNVYYFTHISQNVKEQYSKSVELSQEIDSSLLKSLYKGVYVLYYEQTMRANKEEIEPIDVFIDKGLLSLEKFDQVNSNVDWLLSDLKNGFQRYRYQIDYYASNGTFSESNTSNELSKLINSSTNSLLEEYRNVWMIQYDEFGQAKIDVMKSEDISIDSLEKELLRISKEDLIADKFDVSEACVKDMTNFTIVYGIKKSSPITLAWYPMYDTYHSLIRLIENEAFVPFVISLIVLLVVAYILICPKIWKDERDSLPNRNYLFEIALLGLCYFKMWYAWYCDGIYRVYNNSLTNMYDVVFTNFDFNSFMMYLGILAIVLVVFVIFYGIWLLLVPMLFMGVTDYLKKYSFIYKKQELIKCYLVKVKEDLSQIDFKENTTRRLLEVIAVNFIPLFLVVVFSDAMSWKIGVLLLFVYSLALYAVLKDYVRTIVNDYHKLLETTRSIAEGQLDTCITERMGTFEPVVSELERIQVGFKKAVEEEVKSQRMKTELITNVSHDLKTPLTAITTYVELLKKEDITESERQKYIETLSFKSERMKVLIEDLFEISKVSSDTVTLNLMKVDIVKLIKQVSIEHSEIYDTMNIQLCWNCSHDVIELMLDSQKTYRIFENLFLNISKYAMSNSRVYIDVIKNESGVVVTMKNMSANPLNVPSDELTERFVRGDASRNTEGSGLGLAIAKSFTEIQGGKFELMIDGDLFKTIVSWNNIISKS